jgi:phycoerythrin-associated linker protein
VRGVAKSSFYRDRFFESSGPYRFVELNCKHLLGRAPIDQAEISAHVQLYTNSGYDAEIDSYIDSDEYQDNFGENIVPYYRGIQSQVGQKLSGYTRMFSLFRGFAASDSPVTRPTLATSIANNIAPAIIPPSSGGRLGLKDGNETLYKIVVKRTKFSGPQSRNSTAEYIVPVSRMSVQLQQINRGGNSIVSITELD